MTTFTKQHIVILGGGFGGVAAALELSRAFRKDPELKDRYDITLIDQNTNHLFLPSLYAMSVTLKRNVDTREIERAISIPLRDVFAGKPVRVFRASIEAIDIEKKEIVLHNERALSFAYCILALGSITSFWGIPGAAEYSHPLKTVKDAVRLRDAFEHAVKTRGDNIVIVGAGSTGVELAGELIGFVRKLKRLFPKEWKRTSIHLVEAASSILPGFPEHVIRTAWRRLIALDVRVHTNATLTKITEQQVYVRFQDRHEEVFDYSVVAWAGGVAINPVVAQVVAPKDKRGRCLVDMAMRVGGSSSRVFAIGDATCFTDPITQRPIPANAYVAIEEGKIAAENIVAALKNMEPTHYYLPKYFPFIIPVGGKYAIAYFGWITISGFPGFLLRLITDLRYFASILPPPKALAFWLHNINVAFKND